VSNTYRMNIAIGNSSNVTVSDTTFSQMGLEDCPSGACAVGSIWINTSDNVVFERNTVTGRNNGGGGDGGVDCYASTDVIVRNNSITNTGESAIYSTIAPPGTTSCRNIRVTGNTIVHSNEWGIDMTGLDGAFIDNNHIEQGIYGAIYMQNASASTVTNNVMLNNNSLPLSDACQGITREGYQVDVTYSGNTGNGVLLCNRPF